MAIYRLLKDTTFEPEAVEVMGRAYEDLLGDLGLADRNDPFTEIVAKEIVKIASRGVRSATEIRVQVFTTLGKSASWIPAYRPAPIFRALETVRTCAYESGNASVFRAQTCTFYSAVRTRTRRLAVHACSSARRTGTDGHCR